MTVVGRLGALFVVLSGVAILFVDGFRSPPGLWYAAAGIVAGTTMILYTAISSPSPPRPQAAPGPTSPETSEGSSGPSTTRRTHPTPVDTEQTAKSTESVEYEPEPASDNDADSPELPTSEKSETPSSVVKKPQHFSAKTQSTQRTSSYTGSSRTRKTRITSTHRRRHIASTAAPRQNHSTGTGNSYFKLVDSSGETKIVQIDTKFSYIDIDWGPELIGLDPIPDLVEVDVGPSAVSYELVRSPVEIKISSLLKSLLAPTSISSGTPASNDSTRPSAVADNRARRRTDDTTTGRRLAPRDTWENRHREQDRHVDHRREPLMDADRRQHPAETWPQSSGPAENPRPTTADTIGYGGREEMGTFDGARSSGRRSLDWEPVMDEEPIGPQDVGIADEPAVDVGMDYSPPRWEPQQWDADSFGLTDVDPGFSELEELAVEPVEQPELGFGRSDWESGVLIKGPVIDPEIGVETLGFDGFEEPPEGSIDLSGLDVENRSNPLFSEAESSFPAADGKDDWLTF